MKRALLAVSLLLLSGCAAPVAGTALPGSIEQLGPVGPVPAGLERYYGQRLVWTSCLPLQHDTESRLTFTRRGAQCAKMTVPLDYAKPDGRTASIGLLRVKAGRPQDRIGALVINPGGPGGSGMSAAGLLGGRAADTDLGRRFDIVGFDPRGIGVSTPRIACLTSAQMDAERQEKPPTTVAEAESESKELADACTARTGADVLANVGSREVARDMDVLRSVLGEKKLTYLGYSYGTRIGTAYAEAFPGNVRAMILDGAVDPLEDPVSQRINQIKGFQKALDSFLDWCLDQQSCALGKTLAEVEETLDSLFDEVAAEPAEAGDRTLSVSDLGTAVAASLYSQDSWPLLEGGLGALKRGDASALLLLADTYSGRDPDGTYSDSISALISVRCMDDARVTDPAAVEDAAKRVREAAGDSFLVRSDPILAAKDPCAFWPVPPTASPHLPTVDGLPQVMVVSTTGDPATPYEAGVKLAAALKARLVSYEGVQHTVYLQGKDCVDGAGHRYLIDLVLPSADLRC